MAIEDHRGEVEKPSKGAMRAIRAFCLECMGGSSMEVELCGQGPEAKRTCSLWPYRFGKALWRPRKPKSVSPPSAPRNAL